MGGAKRVQERIGWRGYDYVDGVMCLSHVVDPVLKARLSLHSAAEDVCRLCNSTSSVSSVFVPIQELLAMVMDALQFLYEPPNDVTYDDGYMGTETLGTDEALWEVCENSLSPDVTGDLIDLMVKAIYESYDWTHNRHGSSLDAVRWEWERFVHAVKSESRFIFLPDPELEGVAGPGQSSAAFLWSLLPYVENRALGLLRHIPLGSAFYRGRLVSYGAKSIATAKELGPAPARLASANRMSPEGIPMFYASGTPETAVREIAAHGILDRAVIGTFRNQRDLTVLDLTGALKMPSIFDLDQREAYGVFQFFRDFARAVTTPLQPDSRPHIEYAPTQVVTEFFRWVPTTKIDGIRLESAQDGQPTYVLFFSQDEVADAAPAPEEETTAESPASKHFGFDIYSASQSPVFKLDPAEVKTYEVVRTIEAKLLR